MRCMRMLSSAPPSSTSTGGQALAEEKSASGRKKVKEVLSAINARVIQYETLIAGARAAYGEFLKGSAKADKLDKILKKLD